jgi:hypothetical protein
VWLAVLEEMQCSIVVVLVLLQDLEGTEALLPTMPL